MKKHSSAKKIIIDSATARKGRKLPKESPFELQTAILEATPAFVGYADAKTRQILYINKAGRKMIGLTKDDDVTNLMISDVHPEWTNKMFDNEILPTAIREGVWDGECAFLGRDGREIPVAMVLLAHKAINGEVERFSTISRDITERKRAEDALGAERSFAESLVDTAQAIILVLDTQGRIIRYNSYMADISGYKLEETKGKDWFATFLPQGDHDQIRKLFKRAVSDIQTRGNINSIVCKDGRQKDIEWHDKTLRDSEGNVIGVLAIGLDITDRKRMEEELQKVQKLESLGLLAGGIAHDFNNLMGGIFGYIDMASEESKDEKVTLYLSKAMNTIDRARALTRQLLTFAKGGAPIKKIDHLFPFVQEIAQFALSGSNVSCNFDVPKDLWACNFDKNQIGQVIDNLIINAQQAMPVGGTIVLTARNIALAEKEHPLLVKENYIKLSVKDTGVGIPKELISCIFDPFFTTKAKGHGLGLATCYSIVKRHEGCIDVESEPGKGSAFHVYLPASSDSVVCAAEESAAKHKGSGTILVMDDEEVIRETIQDMLETLGYSVVCKENGKDALAFFLSETKANRTIAAMIFDMTVPGGMGGLEAVVNIRKSNQEIPVFVSSGYANDTVMNNPAEFGFTASICKPFRKVELSEMLEKYLKTSPPAPLLSADHAT